MEGVPAYVVTRDSDKKQKEKVLHQARLLLWFAEPNSDTDCIRVNYVQVSSNQNSVFGKESTNLKSEKHSESGTGGVPRELDYGMDLAKFIPGRHSLDLLHIGCEAKAASMGVLPRGTGHQITT